MGRRKGSPNRDRSALATTPTNSAVAPRPEGFLEILPAKPDVLARSERQKHPRKRRAVATSYLNGTFASVCRALPGGMQTVLDLAYVLAPTDFAIQKFFELWDDVALELQNEDVFCEKAKEAGTDWAHIFGCATEVAMQIGHHQGAMLAAISHADVVARSIREAKRPRGIEDRKMLLQHSGFLPTPKGSTINVNQVAASLANANADQGESVFKSFESDMRELDKAIDVEAEEIQMEEEGDRASG